MSKDHPLVQKLNDGLRRLFKGKPGDTAKQDIETANSGTAADPMSATIAKKAAVAPPVSPSMLLDKAASNAPVPALTSTNPAVGSQCKTDQDSATTDPFATHSSHGRGADS
jgi:hypothetical protein